jgi:hypothetical protein
MLVNDSKARGRAAARKTQAGFKFRQFERLRCGTRHLCVATKMNCYIAYVLPILLLLAVKCGVCPKRNPLCLNGCVHTRC